MTDFVKQATMRIVGIVLEGGAIEKRIEMEVGRACMLAVEAERATQETMLIRDLRKKAAGLAQDGWSSRAEQCLEQARELERARDARPAGVVRCPPPKRGIFQRLFGRES